jgi:RNA polymerase sigma factor (sigma-70 family)
MRIVDFSEEIPELIDYRTARDILINREIQRGVRRILRKMPPKERIVIQLRIMERKTLHECGVEMKLTGERVRQLEKKALTRLRCYVRLKQVNELFGE